MRLERLLRLNRHKTGRLALERGEGNGGIEKESSGRRSGYIAHNRAPAGTCAVFGVSGAEQHTGGGTDSPKHAKSRIFRATARLNYRPNFSARALRTRRTRMISVLAKDLGNLGVALQITAVERELRKNGYLLVLGSVDRATDSVEGRSAKLLTPGSKD